MVLFEEQSRERQLCCLPRLFLQVVPLCGEIQGQQMEFIAFSAIQ